MTTLQSIRGSAGTWIVRFLFVLLIASFAFWGIGDIFRTSDNTEVMATIDSVAITRADLDRALAQRLNRLRSELGARFNREQLIDLGVVDVVLEELVGRTLLNLAAQDQGLLISDDLIRQHLMDEDSFYDDNGQFSPELVRRFLAISGLSEAGFIDLLKEEMTRGLLVKAVTGAASAPEAMVDVLMRHRGEQRLAEALFVDHDAELPALPEPEEAELAQYHRDHPTRFMAPEYRTLSILFEHSARLAEQIDINDDSLRQTYEDTAESFYRPERRTIEHVLLDDKEQAQELLAKTREHSGDLTRALLALEGLKFIDQASQDELGELGAEVFALEPGEIAGPIETTAGWHVLTVTEIIHAGEVGSDDVVSDVSDDGADVGAADARPKPEDESAEDDSTETDTAKAGAAKDELLQPTDIEQVFEDSPEHTDDLSQPEPLQPEAIQAEIPQPERRSVEQLILASETEAQSMLTKARESNNLHQAVLNLSDFEVITLESATREEMGGLGEGAFALAEQEIGGPLESPFGWHVVVVTSIIPALEPSFAEVREELLESLRQERAFDRLFTRINLVDDLLAGRVALDDISARLGITLLQIGPLNRNGNQSDGARVGEPPELLAVLDQVLEQGFSLQEGEQTSVIEGRDGESFFVVRLDHITAPELRELGQVRDQILVSLKRERRRDQVREYDQQLLQRLQAGETLAAVADEINAEAGMLPALTRDHDLSLPLTLTPERLVHLPQWLLERLFTLAPQEVIEGTVSGGTLILRVREIIPLDMANADQQQRDELWQQIDESIAEDLIFQFVDALKQEYETHINAPATDSFL